MDNFVFTVTVLYCLVVGGKGARNRDKVWPYFFISSMTDLPVLYQNRE